jgi:hypothetical protein
MWQKHERLFWKTEGKRFMVFVTLSDCCMDCVSEFCLTSSVCSTAVKFVPGLLINDQKEQHFAVCSELKEQIRNLPNFISTINIGDESWVYGYGTERKQQSSQWKTPH